MIYIDVGKPSREQIKEQLFKSEYYLHTDEYCFMRYLIWKWIDEKDR